MDQVAAGTFIHPGGLTLTGVKLSAAALSTRTGLGRDLAGIKAGSAIGLARDGDSALFD